MNLYKYAIQGQRLARAYSSARQSFQSLGLRAETIAALRKAFPHVESPTSCQEEFIPAVLAGKNVFIKDETGSGKYGD